MVHCTFHQEISWIMNNSQDINQWKQRKMIITPLYMYIYTMYCFGRIHIKAADAHTQTDTHQNTDRNNFFIWSQPRNSFKHTKKRKSYFCLLSLNERLWILDMKLLTVTVLHIYCNVQCTWCMRRIQSKYSPLVAHKHSTNRFNI